MRKYILILIGLAIMTISCSDDTGNEALVGQFNWKQWERQAGWSDYSAKDYTPAPEKIDTITQLINELSPQFILFAANWCGDCETEMPKVMKILNAANFPLDSVLIYGLDYNKQEPSGASTTYRITRTPTLIILRNDIEIGRITEFPTPQSTWENDILQILIQK